MKNLSHILGLSLFTASFSIVLCSCRIGEKSPAFYDRKPDPGGLTIDADKHAGDAAKNYQYEYAGDNTVNYIDKSEIIQLFDFYENAGVKCKGIRVYRTFNNVEAAGTINSIGIVIVGVDDNNKDLINRNGQIGRVIVSYDKCPDNCDFTSPFQRSK
ncbi:hypothetical protein [Hymenobacter sp. APR13]|uniref:hypothetical protein n=1 Tax=Hymenobacter sp. APR13 TaxID=1356852 RepID=UPI0012E0766C|nr:hypothetical protein [Hymenobacter sp. APR13]